MGDEQGRSCRHGRGRGAWEGRELTLGTWGGRRGGVPVEDEQDGGGESTTSRTGGARVGDELGRAGEGQRRSRTGGEEVVRRDGPRPARRTGGGDDQILRGDERMALRSLLLLPCLGLVAARGPAAREFLPRSDSARQNWPPSSSCAYAPA